jgi:hypothetical protein
MRQRDDDGDYQQSQHNTVGNLVSRATFAAHQRNALTSTWDTPAWWSANDDDFAYFSARHSRRNEWWGATVYRHHLFATLT